jgi:hypothetical protein
VSSIKTEHHAASISRGRRTDERVAHSAATGEKGSAADPEPGGAVDWCAALTAESGFYAARHLHRCLLSVAATPEQAATAVDRSPHEPARDALLLTAIERRWVPSPRS